MAPKRLSQAMDEGGGRNGTKQVENVRPRTLRAQRDLVSENVYLGSENREKPEYVLKHMHFGSDFEAVKVICWRRPTGQNEAPTEATCSF